MLALWLRDVGGVEGNLSKSILEHDLQNLLTFFDLPKSENIRGTATRLWKSLVKAIACYMSGQTRQKERMVNG